ncbi:tetratricopeptide repeat protein [Dryocola clanedunensis]
MKKLAISFIFVLCGCHAGSFATKTTDNETTDIAIQVGALNKAEELVVNDLKQNPENKGLRFQLADIYARQNKLDLEYQELSTLKQKSPIGSKDYARVNLAIMRNCLIRNDYKCTSVTWQQAMVEQNSLDLLSDEQKGLANMYIGVAICKENDYDLCIKYLNEARVYLPGNPAIIDNIQLARYMQGMYEKTPDINLLYSGLKNTKSDPIYFNLIMALVNKGDTGKAYELLSMRYPPETSMLIVNDLKKLKSKNVAY